MSIVRIGIIGMGSMGTKHAQYLLDGEVAGAELTAVCSRRKEQLQWIHDHLSEQVLLYDDRESFLNSGAFDVLLIATPHYDHPDIAIAALEKGLHVLLEKPAGVFTKQVRKMNEAAAKSGKLFGMMYNQRTNPVYRKLKEIIASGELGEIKRFNWIVTNWYRSQAYYDSANWRATWSTDGGGVLINQCSHNLDLLQWTLGMMPERIRAFCHFGKHRDIEVEDDVTAYMEFANGATGVFVTSIADSPGTNRYEITGDRGKIVIEDEHMTFWRNRMSEPEFNRVNQQPFGRPEVWKCEIPIAGGTTGHQGITRNFVHAIRDNEALIAPGEEGIYGVILSNAMHLSTWMDNWVDLPLDEDQYYAQLQARMASSK